MNLTIIIIAILFLIGCSPVSMINEKTDNSDIMNEHTSLNLDNYEFESSINAINEIFINGDLIPSANIEINQIPSSLHLPELSIKNRLQINALSESISLNNFVEIELIDADYDLYKNFMGAKQDNEKMKLIAYNRTYVLNKTIPEDDSSFYISHQKNVEIEYYFVVENDYDFFSHTNGVPRIRQNLYEIDKLYTDFYLDDGILTVEYTECEHQSNGFSGDSMTRLGGAGLSQGGSVYYFSQNYKNVYFVKICFSFPCSKDFEAVFIEVE